MEKERQTKIIIINIDPLPRLAENGRRRERDMGGCCGDGMLGDRRTNISSRVAISYVSCSSVYLVLQENASALSSSALPAIECWIIFLIASNQTN